MADPSSTTGSSRDCCFPVFFFFFFFPPKLPRDNPVLPFNHGMSDMQIPCTTWAKSNVSILSSRMYLSSAERKQFKLCLVPHTSRRGNTHLHTAFTKSETCLLGVSTDSRSDASTRALREEEEEDGMAWVSPRRPLGVS